MSESVLFTRRSIRKFNDTPLTDDDFNYLLRAAMYAPTAGDSREGEFVVIKSKETLKKLLAASVHYAPLTTATAAILVCANHDRLKYGPALIEVDGGAISQNILLAATERGIGSVWMAVTPDPERIKVAREVFNLPETIHPVSLIALGHFDSEFPVVKERFNPDQIHYETF